MMNTTPIIKTKIRFGTFNLFQFSAYPFSYYKKKNRFTKDNWQVKKDWIKAQIIKMNCDVIAFQEVFSAQELEELVKSLGFGYFKIVQNPTMSDTNDRLFVSTTVALASKFQIIEIQKVKIYTQSLKEFDFEKQFIFSRIPIKAKIRISEHQDIIVYASHFKSNRDNEFSYTFTPEENLTYKKEQTKKILSLHKTPALKQRLTEASVLFCDIQKNKNIPVVFMCDLNDTEFSLTSEVLRNKSYYTNNIKNDYVLYDAYDFYTPKTYNLHPLENKKTRTPTSYYQNKGNILDYIFVSKHFLNTSKKAFFNIASYEVFDEHLQNNQNGHILQSDHAQVVLEVEYHK